MRLTPARQRPAIDNRRKPREVLGGQGRDRPDDLPLLIRQFSIRLDSAHILNSLRAKTTITEQTPPPRRQVHTERATKT
jgi:hypothetical protein